MGMLGIATFHDAFYNLNATVSQDYVYSDHLVSATTNYITFTTERFCLFFERIQYTLE